MPPDFYEVFSSELAGDAIRCFAARAAPPQYIPNVEQHVKALLDLSIVRVEETRATSKLPIVTAVRFSGQSRGGPE